MTGEELAQRIDIELKNVRERMGIIPGRRDQHIYETDDGKWVRVPMTRLEAFEVEKVVFGQAIADYNYAERSK